MKSIELEEQIKDLHNQIKEATYKKSLLESKLNSLVDELNNSSFLEKFGAKENKTVYIDVDMRFPDDQCFKCYVALSHKAFYCKDLGLQISPTAYNNGKVTYECCITFSRFENLQNFFKDIDVKYEFSPKMKFLFNNFEDIQKMKDKK